MCDDIYSYVYIYIYTMYKLTHTYIVVCSYRYSQQGWENLNGVMKRRYFQSTQRGGGVKNGSSKLLPIVYSLQRALLWRIGYLDGLFKQIGHDGSLNIEYGKVQPMPKYKNKDGEVQHQEDMEAYANTLLKFAPSQLLNDMMAELDELNVVIGEMDDDDEYIEEGYAE